MVKSLLFFLLSCLIVLAPVAAAAEESDDVEIIVTHVSGNVYMLEGAGGNIGVSAGPDGILIVDDQFAPIADKIRSALKDLNSGDLKFVLNTHYHGDHTGGNEIFGREVPIIAQKNVRKRLSTEQNIRGRVIPPKPKGAWPVITFDSSLSIHFNDEEIEVIHFPYGHTDGDVVVFFTKSNVVHMGDHLFSGMFPFVDLDAGGDVEGFIRNIETFMSKLPQDVKVIPGHGPLSLLDDLKANHRMLVETTDYVREQKKAGKSLEQIKAEGLPEEWKAWAWHFISEEVWIEIVYSSLSRNE